MKLVDKISKLRVGKVQKNVDLSKLTTYKLQGKAKCLVLPNSIKSLIKLVKFLKEQNEKYMILGNGSNVIFNDYYDGVLIKLSNLNKITINDTKIVAEAGANLIQLAYKCSKLGLTGLEFATGIPGTVGGAVYMNAGAYNTDMGYIVSEIKVLNPMLEVETIFNRDLNFHYRTSFLQKNKDYICLEATIVLRKGTKTLIEKVIEERKQRRILTQPLDHPSAGSVFKNPEGDYAGRLIESVGYKGYTINGARVSKKHANFVINPGKAKGSDIKKLIKEVQQKVKDETGIELKIEQEFID